MYGSEPSQQWENFFGIIFIQFVACLSGFDFIIISPLYHLIVASSLSFDVGYLFLVGSNVLLSMVVQQLVVILVFLQMEMSAHPSTRPS